jgi:hypothetical protein
MEEDDHWVVVPVQDAELVAQAIVEKAQAIKAAANDGRKGEPQQQLALPAPTPAARTPVRERVT